MNTENLEKILKEKLVKYLEKGEEGVALLMKEFPSLVENYIHYILAYNIISIFYLCIVTGAILGPSLWFLKKEAKKNSYSAFEFDSWWCFIGVVGTFIGTFFLFCSLMSVGEYMDRILHAWYSPATFIYKELIR